jgi:hypothetical protein
LSADSWGICPRCVERANEKFKAAEEHLDKIDPTAREFINIKEPNEEEFRTFREDYEFYVPEGRSAEGENRYVVKYSFSGQCQECFLGINFKGEEAIVN